MVSQSIVSYLVADHARLLTLLNRAMEKPEIEPEAFADFRRGLLRHMAIERKLRLPAVRKARGGTPLARAHELIDHAALTSLLVPTPDLALCQEVVICADQIARSSELHRTLRDVPA